MNDRPKLMTCFSCNRFGHMAKDCRIARRLCFVCGSNDHFIRDCKKRNNLWKLPQRQQNYNQGDNYHNRSRSLTRPNFANNKSSDNDDAKRQQIGRRSSSNTNFSRNRRNSGNENQVRNFNSNFSSDNNSPNTHFQGIIGLLMITRTKEEISIPIFVAILMEI